MQLIFLPGFYPAERTLFAQPKGFPNNRYNKGYNWRRNISQSTTWATLLQYSSCRRCHLAAPWSMLTHVRSGCQEVHLAGVRAPLIFRILTVFVVYTLASEFSSLSFDDKTNQQQEHVRKPWCYSLPNYCESILYLWHQTQTSSGCFHAWR